MAETISLDKAQSDFAREYRKLSQEFYAKTGYVIDAFRYETAIAYDGNGELGAFEHVYFVFDLNDYGHVSPWLPVSMCGSQVYM